MNTLILLRGQPGTGKSMLAKKLQTVLGWRCVVGDEIKEELIADGCPPAYLRDRSYEVLWERVRDELAKGSSLICDTTLNYVASVEYIDKAIADTGAKVVVVACYCDPIIHRERLESRKGQGLSDFWIDSWEKYQTYSQGDHLKDRDIPYPMVHIDTGKSGDDSHVTVLGYLRNK